MPQPQGFLDRWFVRTMFLCPYRLSRTRLRSLGPSSPRCRSLEICECQSLVCVYTSRNVEEVHSINKRETGISAVLLTSLHRRDPGSPGSRRDLRYCRETSSHPPDQLDLQNKGETFVKDWRGGPAKVLIAHSVGRHSDQGDQRGGTHTNEKSHVKFITIGSNGPYQRRKRSNLNPSTSIWWKGTTKTFLMHFVQKNKIFDVMNNLFFDLLIYSEDVSISFGSLFFTVLFSVFSVFVLMFSLII